MLPLLHIVAALEHHMFKEMRETRLSDLFAGTADMVGDINVHDRVAVVLMHHQCQPVGQHVLFIRYDDLSAFADNLLHPFSLGRHP